ncbi:hypothetical protein VB715_15800 [Crocosphaera sp. UHCC 0190]|uniref:hypothetical protein n=1 Tax=Crocosphaera sp. UHCC 0190 TaxID=3110246 RepID=UPI002B21C7DC|nr:hypothetical protein [Crocosphaera sp. UHCC 0190]MEA5511237.1 hypothetical protein [Crocosphaera sp. UHCC 0190]
MFSHQNNQDYPEVVTDNKQAQKIEDEPILCPHCRRTASNGIKCKGICVADSDY